MSRKRDYYEVLGVSKTANPDEIKKAYRKIALAHHPDRSQGNKQSEEIFKEAAEAYEVLSDPKKKTQYDQFGHSSTGFDSAHDPFQSMRGTDIFQEIFGNFESFFDFGGSRSRRSSGTRGNDLRYNLELSFEQAVFGYTTEIDLPKLSTCDVCHGSGAKNASSKITCPTCHGSGQIRIQQGFFQVATTCNTCSGSGEVIKDKCQKCGGSGRVQARKRVRVNIPAGIDNEMRIKLTGEGESGANGGPNGDLYIVVHVKEHPIFERQDDDLFCEVPITIAQATLGATIEVPTLDGSANLIIPASTQSGQIFRLKNKGVHSVNEKKLGNLLIKVLVEVPVSLTKNQKDLLAQFEKSIVDGNYPQIADFNRKKTS